MAAHVVAALEQIKAHIEAGGSTGKLHIGTALGLSTWTEDLDLEDWRSLEHLEKEYNSAVQLGQDHNPASWLPWIEIAIRKYRQFWEQLGEPETREQWRDKFWKEKAYRWLLIDVDWEGNSYGKGSKSYSLAIIPCGCQSCVVSRLPGAFRKVEEE